jgi:nicotinate-nucleotide pyrophosphorylase (carboxylating)
MLFEIERIVKTALEEDLGLGDITTEATIPPGGSARADLVAKEDFTLAGLDVAASVFQRLDPSVAFEKISEDGHSVRKGEVIAWIKGSPAVLLQGERVALNLMQRMCGIATMTAAYVAETAATKAIIVDTRKTVPGLRALDKYAVRMGGGRNHRIGLFDGVLIKENHIDAAGGITAAVERARQRVPHTIKIEVETTSMSEVEEALAVAADIIMLDNMTLEQLRQGVELIAGRALVEASGNVTLERVAEIAATGVDLISVGALTHSVKAADISMLFKR